MDFLAEIEKEYGPKFTKLNETVEGLSERLDHARDSGDEEGQKALTEQIGSIEEQVKDLTADRDRKLRDAEFKAMQTQIASLTEVIEQVREPHSDFQLGAPLSASEAKSLWGDEAGLSFYADALRATRQGDPAARERWEEGLNGKAMTEGTSSAGGYLVPDQISDELLELREQQSVLRPLFSSLQVTSDTLRIPSVTGGLVAGWVAEL